MINFLQVGIIGLGIGISSYVLLRHYVVFAFVFCVVMERGEG